jgi:hypothetical protein
VYFKIISIWNNADTRLLVLYIKKCRSSVKKAGFAQGHTDRQMGTKLNLNSSTGGQLFAFLISLWTQGTPVMYHCFLECVVTMLTLLSSRSHSR